MNWQPVTLVLFFFTGAIWGYMLRQWEEPK